MSVIGGIGSRTLDDVIIFEVSDERVLTVQDMVRTNKARYARNDVHLQKPVSEFTGPDLDTITLKIKLKAEMGVNPKKEMDRLIYIQRDGEAVTLLIGESQFGYYRWTIQDMSMPFEEIDSEGFILSVTCSLTLQEYI